MKPKVNKKDFLDWYFSDRDDKVGLGLDLVQELIEKGRVSIDVNELFYKKCNYIPNEITNAEGYDEDHEFDPSEVELIDY